MRLQKISHFFKVLLSISVSIPLSLNFPTILATPHTLAQIQNGRKLSEVASYNIFTDHYQDGKDYTLTKEQNQSDIAELFDQAAAKHKSELRQLYASRGNVSGPLIDLPDTTSKSVARVLSVTERSYPDSRIEAIYSERTAVLFYSYDKENLQIWLVNERGIQAYHKQKILEKQINEAIANLRNSLGVDSLLLNRNPRRRGIVVTRISNKVNLPINYTINELTQILLPTPITNKLASVKHLIVVPILGLGTVPYAMLQPFKDNSYLIDKMSISIAPSLFDVGAFMYPWNIETAFSSPLIVGNPYLPQSSEWIVPPLPGAEKEAQSVAKILNTTPLIGKEATRETIVSKALNSSLLYFATHGIASSNNPLSGSFLMFSADTFEQGWLTAKQVQNLKYLKAQIAILSACQTGLGRVHDAGIIGLARGFQIAGVPRVVMSLWNVDDAATNELMQAFVKHLKDDIPAEALRKAMVEIKEQRPAPSQWASFVLFGTPR